MLLYYSQTVADIIHPENSLENNKTLLRKSVFYPNEQSKFDSDFGIDIVIQIHERLRQRTVFPRIYR